MTFMTARLSLLSLLLGLAIACDSPQKNITSEEAAATSPAAVVDPPKTPQPQMDDPASDHVEHVVGAHAPVGVVPGSHEDWCGGHQVPESLCTRCNPKLATAFKASGDWCEEHGLPESQCMMCNPDLKIERPTKIAGEDQTP